MKTILNVLATAGLFLVTPSPCFALWDVLNVSKEEAKQLGMEVRAKAAGPNHVSVELEFKTEGHFEAFNLEHKLNNASRVDLWIGQGDNLEVTAALREDRSKAGRIVVHFTVDRFQLNQTELRVMAPYTDGALGGAHYRLRIKDFVELKEDR
jgi:hypothetical protein